MEAVLSVRTFTFKLLYKKNMILIRKRASKI
jgi:hypothetical protein